jgi:ERCC4-type nuclease
LYCAVLKARSVNYPYNYLIISGKLTDLAFNTAQYKRAWTVEHHTGALASIAVRYNVKILQVDNDTQLMKLSKKIIEKTDDGRSIDIENTELLKNSLNTGNLRLKLLTCFNGIGLKGAINLLKHHPSVLQTVDVLIDTMNQDETLKMARKRSK